MGADELTPGCLRAVPNSAATKAKAEGSGSKAQGRGSSAALKSKATSSASGNGWGRAAAVDSPGILRTPGLVGRDGMDAYIDRIRYARTHTCTHTDVVTHRRALGLAVSRPCLGCFHLVPGSAIFCGIFAAKDSAAAADGPGVHLPSALRHLRLACSLPSTERA